MISIYNKTQKQPIVLEAEEGFSFWKKAAGLMLRAQPHNGIVYICRKPKKYAISTFFMNFPIDVLWFDENLNIIAMKEMKPWDYHNPKLEAKFIVECKSGTIKNTQSHIGDHATLLYKTSNQPNRQPIGDNGKPGIALT